MHQRTVSRWKPCGVMSGFSPFFVKFPALSYSAAANPRGVSLYCLRNDERNSSLYLSSTVVRWTSCDLIQSLKWAPIVSSTSFDFSRLSRPSDRRFMYLRKSELSKFQFTSSPSTNPIWNTPLSTLTLTLFFSQLPICRDAYSVFSHSSQISKGIQELVRKCKSTSSIGFLCSKRRCSIWTI